MYRFFSFFFILIFTLGCTNANDEEVSESFGDNKSAGAVANCLCTELDTNDVGLLVRNGNLYTGNCYLTYENSENKYIQKQIVKGLISGKITYFSQDGSILFEEKFEKGAHQINLDIENIRCDCAQLTHSEKDRKYYYRGQLFRGVCFSKFPGTDVNYIEKTYDKGVKNGFTTYYNKLGDILYTEKYENDVLIKVIYPEK